MGIIAFLCDNFKKNSYSCSVFFFSFVNQIHFLLLLAIGTESPADLVINITDPSEKPGSILTTLIDGFLLPKVPQQVEETEKTDATNNNIAIKESEQEITEGGFPVTNILSGIYR